MQTLPLVSVIIPMYRVVDVLPSCLEALLAQSYTNLELVFVDDCSPDTAAITVQEAEPLLLKRGYQVKLIRHDRNQGVASARNTGLSAATGEYLYYFDADDSLEPNAIELMVRRALETSADIVGCEWMLCYEGTSRHMAQPEVKTGREAFQQMCLGTFKWNLWLFFVRRALYTTGETLRFILGANMGEDMMIMGKLFLRANRVSMIHQPLYHYAKTNAGSLTANYTDKHWEQVDTNLKSLVVYAEAHATHEQLRELEFLKLNLKLPLLISPRKSDYDRWAGWFTEANHLAMANKALPLRTRLVQWAAAHQQWWFVRLYYELVMNFLYNLLYK